MPRASHPMSPPLSFVALSSLYFFATSAKSVPPSSALLMSATFCSCAVNVWKSPAVGRGAATWIIATCTWAVGEVIAWSCRFLVIPSRMTS